MPWQTRGFVIAAIALAVVGVGGGAALPADEPAASPFDERLAPPVVVTVESGQTSATVVYSIPPGWAYFRATLTIDRAGKRAFDGDVLPYSKEFSGTRPVAVHGDKPITVIDLDGDGEPEVLVDLFWGGVHCCWWSRIYRWNALTSSYTSSAHLWGNFDYRLADLDKDQRMEFVSADNRFAYEFSSFGGSSFPLQVLTYREGELVDSTRSYLRLINKDAEQQWRWYQETVTGASHYDVRGLLAAWAADECLLDRCEAAFSRLREVSNTFADEAADSAAEYLQHLETFLRQTGYLRPDISLR